MSGPARRRATDRFVARGIDADAAAALAALAHPFDGPGPAPPAQVRTAIQSEADAFRTASAGIDDVETLLWLGTTVADRYVTTAAGSGAPELAEEFRGVRDAMDRGIRSARSGPAIPPLGPVTPGDGPTPVAWPGAARSDGPPPPPAAAGTGPPPPSWPGATVEDGDRPPRRRGRALLLLVAIPVVLLVVLGGVIAVGGVRTVEDVGEALPEPIPEQGRPEDFGEPPAPLPEPLPDLERASQDAFLAVLEHIVASEDAMGGFQAAVASVADVPLEEATDAVAAAAQRAREDLLAAREAITSADLGDEPGDLPGVLDAYLAHQDAWLAVWEAAEADPRIVLLPDAEPVDLYADVNATADEFAPAFGAVVPRGLDQDEALQVLDVLSGFGPIDLDAVFGPDAGSTV